MKNILFNHKIRSRSRQQNKGNPPKPQRLTMRKTTGQYNEKLSEKDFYLKPLKL